MASESPIESKRVVRNLAVSLSDAEVLEFGRRLAQANSDCHNEEERQKQVKTELKSKLEGFELERNRLAGMVASGRENRDVPCDMVFDYSRLIVEVIRLDTKEVVETRRMTEAEQQRSLFGEKKENEQFGGTEASPEQVQQIKEHLQRGRADEKVAEVTAAIAKSDNLFLTAADVKAMSQEDWDELVKVAGGGSGDAIRFLAIIDRAHIAAERSGGEQHCTDCGARLPFEEAGLIEGFPEASLVGQGCDRKVGNGPMT